MSVAGGEAGAGPPADTGAEPPLEWTYNPWRRNAAGALLGLALIVVLGVQGWGFGDARLPVLAAVVAFAVSVSPGFVPTRYRVGARDVARRVWFAWHRREWAAIRRAVVRPRPQVTSIWVSTEPRPGLLDNLRGMALVVPHYLPDHERLLGELRQRLALHGL